MFLQEDFQKLVSNFRRIRFESTVCLCLVFFSSILMPVHFYKLLLCIFFLTTTIHDQSFAVTVYMTLPLNR
jgi:hypothetical protein